MSDYGDGDTRQVDGKGGGDLVLVDDPAPHVRRITLNRPEKRNALNHPLRGQLIAALHAADLDPDVDRAGRTLRATHPHPIPGHEMDTRHARRPGVADASQVSRPPSRENVSTPNGEPETWVQPMARPDAPTPGPNLPGRQVVLEACRSLPPRRNGVG